MADPTSNLQINFNRSTVDKWGLYTSHRRRVMDLILSGRSTNARSLCVLGAGNCNDLDLNVLTRCFKEIHLVDIDYEALSGVALRQSVHDPTPIILHGGVDITGVFKSLAAWYSNAPRQIEIDNVLKRIEKLPAIGISKSLDVVVSATVLTQLINTAVNALGANHPRLLEISLAIRNAHIRLLVNLVSVGGTGVLITDLVSSDTCEKLKNIPEEEMPELMRYLLSVRNFFTGVNPFVLGTIMRQDPYISPRVSDVVMKKPWRWSIGPERAYLVCGLTFRRVAIG